MVAKYLIGILTALSQLGNALIGGHPGESLSHRAACSQDKTGWRLFGALLEFFHRGHLPWALMNQRPRQHTETHHGP